MKQTVDEFDYLHKILLTFNKSIMGEELHFDSNEYYKYEFFNKMYSQYITISSLKNGSLYHTDEGTYKVNDITSVIVLLRSTLETLLMFYYLFLDARDTEEFIFRLNCWRHQGILTRYNLSKQSSNYQQNGMLQDQKRLKDLSNQIKDSIYWKSITNIKKFNQFGTFSPSWNTLLKKISANKFITNTIYSFFSSYAHSEYLNLSQLTILQLENKTNDTINIYRRFTFPIYSTFLVLFQEVINKKINISEEQNSYLINCSDFFIDYKKMFNRLKQEN